MDHTMPAGDGAPLPDLPAPAGMSWESRLLVPHAEMAFELCGQVVKQAKEANWVGMGGDTMFARFSHAMHVSISLKAKLEAAAERRARHADAGLPPEAEERAARARRGAAAQDRVEAAVAADPADAARLRLNLAVRLGHLNVTREVEGRAFGEVLAEVRRDLGLAAEGFEVPADVPTLTRLASLGTLSRGAGEGKEALGTLSRGAGEGKDVAGAVGPAADVPTPPDDGWPDDAVLQAVIGRPPCSLWMTAATVEEERLESLHDPP